MTMTIIGMVPIDDSAPSTSNHLVHNNVKEVIGKVTKIPHDYEDDGEEHGGKAVAAFAASGNSVSGSISSGDHQLHTHHHHKHSPQPIGEVNNGEQLGEMTTHADDRKNNNGILDSGNDVVMGDSGLEGSSKTSETGLENSTSTPSDLNDNTNNAQNNDKKSSSNKNNNGKPKDGSSDPPPPLLKGKLSANLAERKHILEGMWNYDYSSYPPKMMPEKPIPAQKFELIRVFDVGTRESEILQVPSNGTFNGSFTLCFYAQTKNGKFRERTKVVQETGVAIKFEPVSNNGSDEYNVSGRGTNQFGEFDVYGTAKPTDGTPHVLDVELRKKYVTPSAPPEKKKRDDDTGAAVTGPLSKKQKLGYGGGKSLGNDNTADQVLPDPSPTFPSGVVCMRGRLFRVQGSDLGVQDNIHRMRGQWATGLDYLLADPNNERGNLLEFLYEHKSIAEKCDSFPLTGRYTGWFDLIGENNEKTRISEKDVSLKFKPNNAEGFNVEGKGSNVFGKYTITGTLEADPEVEPSMDPDAPPTSWLITIFKHFQVRKQKKQKKNAAAGAVTASEPVAPVAAEAAAPLNLNSTPTAPPVPAVYDPSNPLYTLDDVVIPGLAEFKPSEDQPVFVPKSMAPPESGKYTALSRGVLRIADDGAHTCGGKWAISREHFTSGITSNFHFGIDAQHAVETTKNVLAKDGRLPDNADSLLHTDLPKVFPIDSANYKGSFKMKRGATKYSSVVDNQIVLKFMKNDVGAYNVYGVGHNSIGRFNLIGSLIPQGQTTGTMELYRIYMETIKPPEKPPAVKPSPVAAATTVSSPTNSANPSLGAPESVHPLSSSFERTVSGRSVKLPARLEEADPKARMARLMDKCGQILTTLLDEDRRKGKYFHEAVDPVALGIPTYHDIIKSPMDLGTIQRKLVAGEVSAPDEFAKLVRLVFDNAMRFNVDPSHTVHSAALHLLVLFNRKFSDVERLAAASENAVPGGGGANGTTRRLTKSELKAKQREEKRKQKEALKEEKRRKQKEEKLKKQQLQRQKTEEQPSGLPAPHDLPGAAAVAAAASSSTAPEGYIAKSEFDKLQKQMDQMQQMLASFQKQLTTLGAKVWKGGPDKSIGGGAAATDFTIPADDETLAVAKSSSSASSGKKLSKSSTTKASSKSKKVSPVHAPAPPPPPPPPEEEEEDVEEGEVEEVEEEEKEEEEVEQPLSIDEQEKMTEIINELGGEHLNEVIKIIREGTKLGDEDEIDLEIDLLPVSTQRKLQNFVLKFAKTKKPKKVPGVRGKPGPKPKNKGGKQQQSKASAAAAAAPAPVTSPPARAASPPAPAPPVTTVDTAKGGSGSSKKETNAAKKAKKKKKKNSFFGMDDNSSDESDDDTEDESDDDDTMGASSSKKGSATGDKTLRLPDQTMDNDDDDDDEDDVVDGAAFHKKWDMAKLTQPSGSDDDKSEGEESEDDSDDEMGDLWSNAKQTAKTNKQLEVERKEREEKLHAQAEQERKERLEAVQAAAEEVRAKQKLEEEEQKRVQEEEARKAEERREQAKKAIQSSIVDVQQTVDMDEQRKIMNEIETSMYDDFGGGSSPGSEFGF